MREWNPHPSNCKSRHPFLRHRLEMQHGYDAPIWAAQKADAMLERGNLDGERLWLSILAAIEELQAKVRPTGTVVR